MHDLLERVEAARSCVVLETTNLLTSRTYKVNQAKRSKAYLQDTTGKVVGTGLVHSYKPKDFKRKSGLDIIARIDHFDQETAIAALEKVIEFTRGRDNTCAKQILGQVLDGIALEELLYPKQAHWAQFRASYPHLAPGVTTSHGYMNALGGAKGHTIPEYVREAFSQESPTTTVLTNQLYVHNNLCGDIDVLLLGDKKAIWQVLSNEKYFTVVQQSKAVKKASRRIKKVA